MLFLVRVEFVVVVLIGRRSVVRMSWVGVMCMGRLGGSVGVVIVVVV